MQNEPKNLALLQLFEHGAQLHAPHVFVTEADLTKLFTDLQGHKIKLRLLYRESTDIPQETFYATVAGWEHDKPMDETHIVALVESVLVRGSRHRVDYGDLIRVLPRHIFSKD